MTLRRLLAAWFAVLINAAPLVPAQAQDNTKPAATVQRPAERPERFPIKAFAGSDAVRSAKLSPNGKRLAFTTMHKELLMLVVTDPMTRQSQFTFTFDGKQELKWFRWAGNDKVMMSLSHTTTIDMEEVRYTRLIVSNVVTGKTNYIGPAQMGIVGDDVLYVDPEGGHLLLALQRSIYEYPSVWTFPLDETARKAGREIQKPIPGAWDWYADDKGNIRMAFVYAPGSVKVLYRTKPEEKLRETIKMTSKDWEQKSWDVMRIFAGSNSGYVIERNLENRAVVASADYGTRTTGDTVFAQPGSDITDFDLDDDNKLKAVYYTDDADRIAWVDPKMKAIQNSLNRALPGSEAIIGSRAKDNSRMLVWQSHAGDPGTLYIYDLSTRRLEELARMRPDLDPRKLARPKAIDYKARDKVSIRAYLTLPVGREPKGLPLIVLPHGGPYWVRDKLQYDDEVQLLANRGYAVLQPNYRGSEGYGEGFAGLGEGQIGRAMQDDLDDGMDHLVKEGLVDAKRVCIVGSSYGGYAAAWGAIRNPERYRCAASFAGVMNWQRQVGYTNRFESDPKERRKWSRQVRGGEEGTFNVDLVSPAKQVGRLTRPLLLVHGTKDSRVPFSQFKEMREAAVKAGVPVEPVVLEGVGHSFESSKETEKWLTALDTFLAKHNPAD
jgi:dipeptidyl aminopeptidase/acylaminoacyl peptidase